MLNQLTFCSLASFSDWFATCPFLYLLNYLSFNFPIFHLLSIYNLIPANICLKTFITFLLCWWCSCWELFLLSKSICQKLIIFSTHSIQSPALQVEEHFVLKTYSKSTRQPICHHHWSTQIVPLFPFSEIRYILCTPFYSSQIILKNQH